tara:strand:- start:12802 stop:13446 length:645 start_codon:yes stop_codon:yes gene_type:complete
MNNKPAFNYLLLLASSFALFLAFSPSPQIDYKNIILTTEQFNYNFDVKASAPQNESLHTPFLENSYVAFKEALAFKESQGNYSSINTLGYLGKFQFGVSTLELLGVHNPELFLENPALQEKTFLANTRRNKWVLRRYIKRFSGMKINGIIITESGLLAAAHLAGPGNVKRYLISLGALDFTDAYGTGIPLYLHKFSGYDTSFVSLHKNPKVHLL